MVSTAPSSVASPNVKLETSMTNSGVTEQLLTGSGNLNNSIREQANYKTKNQSTLNLAVKES